MNRVRVSRLWETEQLMPAEKRFQLENVCCCAAAAVIKSRNLAGQGNSDNHETSSWEIRNMLLYPCKYDVDLELLNTKQFHIFLFKLWFADKWYCVCVSQCPPVASVPAGVTRSELIPCAGSELKAGQSRAVNTSAAAPPVNTPHNNPPLVPAIVREICRDGISLFTCLWFISRSELLLFTLWLLLLLWYRKYTLGCVHLKRDCLELGHGSPAIYCSETHVGNAGNCRKPSAVDIM